MEFIPTVELSLGDILVVYVGVGSLPKAAAEKYLQSIQIEIRKPFDEKQAMLFIASADEHRSIKFAVIRIVP